MESADWVSIIATHYECDDGSELIHYQSVAHKLSASYGFSTIAKIYRYQHKNLPRAHCVHIEA